MSNNLFRFSAWPITTKLIVVMALIAIVPAAIVGVVIGWNMANAVISEIDARVAGTGESEDLFIESWVQERVQDVNTLAGLARTKAYETNPESAKGALDEYQQMWGVYESMGIFGLDGQSRVQAGNAGAVSVTDRAYFKEALKGTTAISQPVASRSTGNPVVVIASPVMTDGKIIGVVLATIPMTTIQQTLNQINLGTTGEAYVVTGDGTVVTPLKYEDQLKLDKSAVLNYKIDTVASRALAAKSESAEGQDSYTNYIGKTVVGAYYWMSDLELGLIVERQQDELAAPILRIFIIAVAVSVVAVLLAVLIAFLMARVLTTQIHNIMDLFGNIGIGDFSSRAEVVSEDELGTMAISMNAMLDNILSLIQTRAQRDEIQGAIMKLLDEVSGVADGDLSREAEVTADMTGAIADAFNYMIAQLRNIIKTVQQTTQSVSGSAAEIRSTAEHLSQGSESQARQIGDTSEAVQEMSTSIAQVSENAALSASVSQQALANAQSGAKAVQDTIEGMNRIRDQVQETAKRIKRLGESSQEIGEIVQLIEDIADRTSILALNASIQAAMAGEAGRGFAVVAEEVERLADRSTQATKQISTLIKTTQSETTEAVAAMETTTREVVEGSRLADQAGQALSEIENVSNQLAELIQSISSASKQQSRGSENLARSMMEISEVTQQTAAGTRQAAVAINQLATLADQLRDSVSQFKLPSNGHSAN